jgi:proteasome lid subunit RPN8/RPN11
MKIEIHKTDLHLIKQHSEKDYPNECCGFLLGKAENGKKTVVLSQPVQNYRESKNQYNRFEIPPHEYIKAEQFAKSNNLDIVGFYHSHPNAEAQPSQYDLDHSWPFYSYIIVSVKNKKSDKTTSWQLKENRSEFIQEEIVEINNN